MTIESQSNNDSSVKQQVPPAQESWLAKAYDWTAGAADVGAQVVVGAASKVYHAVKDDPLGTAIMVGEGAAVGVALIAAAPVAAALGAGAGVVAGVAVAADAVIVGMTATGAAAAAKDTIQAAKDSAGSADVLMHQSAHSQAEIEAARADIQKKTGGVALEVVGVAAMAGGTVGAGMRVASAATSGLKNGITAAAGMGDAVAALPKLTIHNPGEFVAAMEKPPKMAGKAQVLDKSEVKAPSEKTEPTQLCPPQAITEFSEKLGDFIGSREEKISVNKLLEKRATLDEERVSPIKIVMADKTHSLVGLRNAEWQIEPFMRTQLKDKPEASKLYDQYLAENAEIKLLDTKIEKEMATRREGVAKIINDERGSLFPGQVVPAIKVHALPEKATELGTYHRGIISIKDSDLYNPPNILRGDKISPILLHETKHAEQDALLIRKTIDAVTKNDTSGRALTKAELNKITKITRGGKFDADIDEIINDVNRQRAGRPLTADEQARATRLEEGISQHIEKSIYSKINSERLGGAIREQKGLADGRVFPSELLEEDNFRYYFGRKPSPELANLKSEYDALPKDSNGLPIHDDDFDDRALPTIKKAFEEKIKELRQKAIDDHQEYRSWAHEKEAWEVGDATRKELSRRPPKEVLEDFILSLMEEQPFEEEFKAPDDLD